jgi:hypothetical protein
MGGLWFKASLGKSCQDPVFKKKKKELGVVTHSYNPAKQKGRWRTLVSIQGKISDS